MFGRARVSRDGIGDLVELIAPARGDFGLCLVDEESPRHDVASDIVHAALLGVGVGAQANRLRRAIGMPSWTAEHPRCLVDDDP